MIGDSFIRGIRENVKLSLSNKFGIYSMVKPGSELNNLLESANSASGSPTQKDVIFNCGGSMTLILIRVNQLLIKSWSSLRQSH
jgi:hypothetical protein